MARAIAAAAVLAAVLTTAPAGAESVCIHKDNCHALPGPNLVGGGITDHFTVVLRVNGSTVLNKTGVLYHSKAPIFEGGSLDNDNRVQLCGNGACSGIYGYTVFHDQHGQRVHVYADGRCTVFADHHGWFPQQCHSHPH